MDIFQKQLFCISLSERFQRVLHPSIDVYVAKSSGRIQVTANIDLMHEYFRISDIVWQHLFHDFWFRGNDIYDLYRCFRLKFCQQKGLQFDYFFICRRSFSCFVDYNRKNEYELLGK